MMSMMCSVTAVMTTVMTTSMVTTMSESCSAAAAVMHMGYLFDPPIIRRRATAWGLSVGRAP
jgi:hypothetical protein